MNLFSRLKKYLDNNIFLSAALIFSIAALFFSWLQATPFFADPDAFYHIKMAELMRQHLVIRSFPYLQFTVLKDGYIDHHFLYHIILMPFISFFPDWIGAKIAQVILDSIFVMLFFVLLKKLKVAGAAWYALILLFSASLVYRLSLIKAQPLSLIIIFLATYLIIKNKYYWLIPLSFIYVWTYGGWMIILGLAGAYVLADAWSRWSAGYRHENNQRVFLALGRLIFSASHFKLIASVLAGLILGLLINPYFPQNFIFYWIQTIQIGLFNFQGRIGVGAEWYPYEAWQLLSQAVLPTILILSGWTVFWGRRKKMDTAAYFLFAIAVVFFIATIKARRNIEYFIPLGVFFSAVIFNYSFVRDDFAKLVIYLKASFLTRLTLTVIILILCLASVVQVRNVLSQGYHHSYLKEASVFLRDYSKSGDIVFNVEWDMFPILFYNDSSNYYIVGLDPTFMYLYSPALYEKWHNISQGDVADVYQVVKKDFRAKYFFLDHPTSDYHQKLLKQLQGDEAFKEIYRDQQAIIYEVL